MAAYDKKEFARAAELLQKAVVKGARKSGMLYYTACSLALAGDKERAFQFLNMVIGAGWRETARMNIDSALKSLHDDPRWRKVIEASEKQDRFYRQVNNEWTEWANEVPLDRKSERR